MVTHQEAIVKRANELRAIGAPYQEICDRLRVEMGVAIYAKTVPSIITRETKAMFRKLVFGDLVAGDSVEMVMARYGLSEREVLAIRTTAEAEQKKAQARVHFCRAASGITHPVMPGSVIGFRDADGQLHEYLVTGLTLFDEEEKRNPLCYCVSYDYGLPILIDLHGEDFAVLETLDAEEFAIEQRKLTRKGQWLEQVGR